jgi:hypothetical protein
LTWPSAPVTVVHVKPGPTCPRCGMPLRAPGLMSSDWQCDVHGAVFPLQPVPAPSRDGIAAVVRASEVPVWAMWPLPFGWVVTGVAHVGDERSGIRALAVACSGPAPLGGGGDVVIIAEEPAIGFGARYAGLPGPDPGEAVDVRTPPHAKIQAGGHPTPLWSVSTLPDRAAYVGEAAGLWLWAVFWPESAGHLLQDDVVLADLRDVGAEIDLLPLGALSPRLTP